MTTQIPRLISRFRIPLIALALSANGIQMMKDHEGFSATAYPDPTYGWQVPTIGYGTTEGVRRGDVITEPEAERRLVDYVNKNLPTFRRCVVVPLSQKEFDLYVDFYYNIGATAFCSSTLVRHLKSGNYTAAAQQVLRWKYSNGIDCSVDRRCRGLWNRRVKMYNELLAEIRRIETEQGS